MSMDMVEYAIRYCITRTDYAYEDGLRWAERHWHRLSYTTRCDVIEQVRARPEATPNPDRYPKITAAAKATQ